MGRLNFTVTLRWSDPHEGRELTVSRRLRLHGSKLALPKQAAELISEEMDVDTWTRLLEQLRERV